MLSSYSRINLLGMVSSIFRIERTYRTRRNRTGFIRAPSAPRLLSPAAL